MKFEEHSKNIKEKQRKTKKIQSGAKFQIHQNAASAAFWLIWNFVRKKRSYRYARSARRFAQTYIELSKNRAPRARSARSAKFQINQNAASAAFWLILNFGRKKKRSYRYARSARRFAHKQCKNTISVNFLDFVAFADQRCGLCVVVAPIILLPPHPRWDELKMSCQMIAG